MENLFALVIIALAGYFIYTKFIKGIYESEVDNKPDINKIEDDNTSVNPSNEEVKEHTLTLKKDKLISYLKMLPVTFILTSIVILFLESSVRIYCTPQFEETENYSFSDGPEWARDPFARSKPRDFNGRTTPAKRTHDDSYFGNSFNAEFKGSYTLCDQSSVTFPAYVADLGETIFISLVLNFILIYLIDLYSRNKIKIQIK
jgi:hypothetical protein